jgi:hypothetical protein
MPFHAGPSEMLRLRGLSSLAIVCALREALDHFRRHLLVVLGGDFAFSDDPLG